MNVSDVPPSFMGAGYVCLLGSSEHSIEQQALCAYCKAMSSADRELIVPVRNHSSYSAVVSVRVASLRTRTNRTFGRCRSLIDDASARLVKLRSPCAPLLAPCNGSIARTRAATRVNTASLLPGSLQRRRSSEIPSPREVHVPEDWRFHTPSSFGSNQLRIVQLPQGWGLGGVIWSSSRPHPLA